MSKFSATKQKLGNKLKLLRKRKGYTQQEIGKIMGKAHTTIASWEAGKGQPDISTFLKLCECYGVWDIMREFGDTDTVGATTIDETRLLTLYRDFSTVEKECFLRMVNELHTLITIHDRTGAPQGK